MVKTLLFLFLIIFMSVIPEYGFADENIFKNSRTEVFFPAVIDVSDKSEVSILDLLSSENLSLESKEISALEKEAFQINTKNTGKVIISREELYNRLKENEEIKKIISKYKWQVSMPNYMTLKIKNGKVLKNEVERKVALYLKANCPDCEFKVSVTQDVRIVNRNWTIDYNSLQLKSSFLLPLITANNEEIVSSNVVPKSNLWISGQVKIFKYGYISNKLISVNSKLSEQDITKALIEITNQNDSLAKKDEIINKLSQRVLNVNSPIFSNMVKKEYAVKRGQTLKAIIGNQDFELSTTVIAEGDGFVGDNVKIKNIDNQKLLSAKIVENGVVQIY